MSQQSHDRVVVSPQLLLTWNQTMNRPVAVAASVNRFAHLNTREVLLEPAIFVTRPRNQMVLRRSPFQNPTA